VNELFKILFGDFTLVQLFGYSWFFLIGYIINFLSETTGRDVKSKNTPQKWNWKFWIKDNYKRYITTILCTYILFRFYTEMSGHDFGYYDAVILGLLGDGVSATIKKRVKGLGNENDRRRYMENNDEEVYDSKNEKDINNNIS